MFAGSYDALLADENSLTAAYLSRRRTIPFPARNRKPLLQRSIKIAGAHANNLKNIDVEIPLGVFVCITGVSGSGKSSLVDEVLHRNLKKLKEAPTANIVHCTKIEGIDKISEVVLVDQSPVGTTPRSNPVTYMRGLRCHSPALCHRRSLADARLHAIDLFFQCGRRTLRNLSRRRLRENRDAVPLGCLHLVPRVSRQPVP